MVSPPPCDHLAQVEHSNIQALVLSSSSPNSFENTIVPHHPWPLHYSHFPDQGHTIAISMSAGTALAICNSSYMPTCFPHLTAVAWILHPGPDSTAIPCHGATQVQGKPHMINSYRAELQGLLTVLLAVNDICSEQHVTTGCITISCNNQGVLHHVLHPTPYVPCAIKHADLVWAIYDAPCCCPITLHFQYIPGHQDILTQFKDLPILAQLNVQANQMAKQALHLIGDSTVPPILAALPGVS